VGMRFSVSIQTDHGAQPVSSTMVIVSPSQGKNGQDMAWTTHPHLKLRSKKEYSNTSNPLPGLHGLF